MAAFTSAIGQPPHTHTALFWANSIPLDLSDTTMADVSTVKGDVYLVAHVKSDKGLWKVLLSLHLTSDGDVAGTAQYEACTSKSSKKKAKGGTGEFKRLERGDGATVLPRKMGMVRAGAGLRTWYPCTQGCHDRSTRWLAPCTMSTTRFC